jgi:Family of unknown function (DUF6247)
MTVQRHDRPGPRVERSFTAVRAALPAENAAAFDAEFAKISAGPVTDFAAVDEFLAGWHRIAVRIVSDPEDWALMHREAAEIMAGTRPKGPTLAEVLARRGIQVPR